MTTLVREGTSAKVLDVPAGLRESLIELESPVLVLTLLRMLGCLLEDAFELLLLLLVVVLLPDFFSRDENECNANAGDIDICMQRGKRKERKKKGFRVWELKQIILTLFFPNMNVR